MKDSRYNSNKEILQVLELIIDRFPNWRFHQILQNIDIIDKFGTDLFFEESNKTLKKVKNNAIVRRIIFKDINNF